MSFVNSDEHLPGGLTLSPSLLIGFAEIPTYYTAGHWSYEENKSPLLRIDRMIDPQNQAFFSVLVSETLQNADKKVFVYVLPPKYSAISK